MKGSLGRIFNLNDAEVAARRILPRPVFDFYSGGAEAEVTLARNSVAFDHFHLLPRVLTGAASPSLTTQFLDLQMALPVIVAPMGAVGFGRRGGDLDLARAARNAGIANVLSAVATASIESVGAANPGKAWFQLYPLRDRALMRRLIGLAADAGYSTLVITVDVPEGGKRERDLRNDFNMPFHFTARNLLRFAARPMWAVDMLMRGVPKLANLADPLKSSAATASSVGAGFDPSFNWSDVEMLRREWPGNLLIKGVLRADDAVSAREIGSDGIILSNHGGRQLDGAASAINVVATVRAAVGPSMPLVIDGGIRRGTDVVKALALGATAVMLGRPLLYGAVIGGEAGVQHVLQVLADELRRALVLCGVHRLTDLTPDLVTTSINK